MYIEYFALLIPIIGSLVTFLLWKHKLVWWEMLLPIVICGLLILIFSVVARNSLTNDVEYWNDYVTTVQYFEEWNEEVPCSHSYDCFCSTDSNGNECCCMTCYEHSYDVDYHPERWTSITNNGWHNSIKKVDFDYWRKKWENTQFKDLGRDYHTIDGDMYYSSWKITEDTSLVYTKKHSYKNKTQAAYSVFKYTDITDAEASEIGLFKYPNRVGFGVDFLLGYTHSTFEPQLQLLNGWYGNSKQITNWVLIYRNKGIDQAFKQESYWKGGNKNESVLCISIDYDGIIQWSKVFSWSESEDFKYDLQQLFQSGKNLDSLFTDHHTFLKYSELIETEWKRKEFADFDYIQVPLKSNQLIWIFSLTFIVTIGTLIFGIMNDIEYDNNGKIITK